MPDPKWKSVRPEATDDPAKHEWLQMVKAQRGLKARPQWPNPRGPHRRIAVSSPVHIERVEPAEDIADAA